MSDNVKIPVPDFRGRPVLAGIVCYFLVGWLVSYYNDAYLSGIRCYNHSIGADQGLGGVFQVSCAPPGAGFGFWLRLGNFVLWPLGLFDNYRLLLSLAVILALFVYYHRRTVRQLENELDTTQGRLAIAEEFAERWKQQSTGWEETANGLQRYAEAKKTELEEAAHRERLYVFQRDAGAGEAPYTPESGNIDILPPAHNREDGDPIDELYGS